MPWETEPHIPNTWLRLDAQLVKLGCCDCGVVTIWQFRTRRNKMEVLIERNDEHTEILRAQQASQEKVSMSWGNTPYKPGKWMNCKPLSMVCSDCGLVHTYQFRVRRGSIEMFIQRDEEATAVLRRQQLTFYE